MKHLFAKWSRRGEVERTIYEVIGNDEFTRAEVVRLVLERGGVLAKLQTKSRRAAVDDALTEMRNSGRLEIAKPASTRGEAHIYRCPVVPDKDADGPQPDRPAATMTMREEVIVRLACAMASNARYFAEGCPKGRLVRDYVNECAIDQADALIAAMGVTGDHNHAK